MHENSDLGEKSNQNNVIHLSQKRKRKKYESKKRPSFVHQDRPSREVIFESWFLERMTLVRWYTPFVVWIPFIVFLFYRNISKFNLFPVEIALNTFFGILLWTLAEYLIHRFPFHYEAKSKWAKEFVYKIHGNHHNDPNDPLRGVMPIMPAALYITILYGLFWCLTPSRYTEIFYGSFLIGYLLYDGLHYYTHHGKPKNKVLKFLRKKHLLHHVHDDKLFGISTPLWDVVFGTYKTPKETR